MSDISVISKSQKIIVDAASASVSIVSVGPQGPAGSQGPTGPEGPVGNTAATTQAGTSYTLALSDAHSSIIFSNAALVTVTIPLNASVAFSIGARLLLFAAGAAGLTLSTTGITLLGSSPMVTVAQNEALFVEKTGTDTWMVLGGTS